MTKRVSLLAAAAALLLTALPMFAHHSFGAEFDANKPVKLRGKVVRIEFVNPHAWIHIEVKEQDGTSTDWMIEGGSPNALVRHGITKDTLPVGSEVIFEGSQAKDGSHRANGQHITLADGKKLFLGASGSEGAEDKK